MKRFILILLFFLLFSNIGFVFATDVPNFELYPSNPLIDDCKIYGVRSIAKHGPNEFRAFVVKSNSACNYPADFNIDLLTSTDGLNWSETKSGIINRGLSGRTFNYYLSELKEDGIYKAWHFGTNDWCIAYDSTFYSESIDGLNYGNTVTVLTRTEPYENRNLGYPNVIKVNDLYYLYHNTTAGGRCSNFYKTGTALAISTDGINWEKHGLIIGPEYYGLKVVFDNEQFEAFAMKKIDNVWVPFYLISPDGKEWFDVGQIDSLPDNLSGISGVIKEGNKYSLWYYTSDKTFNLATSIIPSYGTTIITHGFLPEFWGDDDGLRDEATWTVAMAKAIGKRAQNATIYYYRDGSLINQDVELIGNGAGENGSSGEVILVYDWIEESDRRINGYAEAAGDSLFANLIEGAIQEKWSLENLHFIGHSRGCLVNSESIQRLLWTASSEGLPMGISLDQNIQMTTLDPHPSVIFQDNVINGDIGSGVIGWKAIKSDPDKSYRVSFIDNYFQRNLPIPGLKTFPGSGYDKELSEMGADTITTNMNHSGIHAWYHGTIDPDAEDDGIDPPDQYDNPLLNIAPYRDEWYSSDPSVDYQIGYHMSRIGGINNELFRTDDIRLISVDQDNTFIDNDGNPNLVFNNDFSKHGISGDNWLPGWELQGGGGEGHVDDDYLELDENNAYRKHNKMYIPTNVDTLIFHYDISNIVSKNRNPDRIIIFSDEDEWGINDRVKEIILDKKEKDWAIVDISKWKGSVRTLTFQVVNGDYNSDDIGSQVEIDDITIGNADNPSIATAILISEIENTPNLTKGIVNSLGATLKEVITHIQNNKITSSVNKILAFICKVECYLLSGDLDDVSADYFSTVASEIITDLDGDPSRECDCD